jgi:hypothetical protein
MDQSETTHRYRPPALAANGSAYAIYRTVASEPAQITAQPTKMILYRFLSPPCRSGHYCLGGVLASSRCTLPLAVVTRLNKVTGKIKSR